MSAVRLIVSADDLGLGPSVDRGIVAAVAAGSVTSVGVIANLVEPRALAECLQARPGLSLGVHLNLTTGRPLRPAHDVMSLVDAGGEFLPLATLARRALAGQIRPAEVWRELGAQLARARDLGAVIDHFDSHEHVHLLPGVMGAVIRLAHAAGVPRIRTHRPLLLAPSIRDALVYYRRHPRRLLTHAAKHLLALRLRRAGLATPDGMVASSLLARPVPGGPLAEWEAIASALPPGTWELVVHPADLSRTMPDERIRLGDLVERRGAELAALLDPRWQQVLTRHRVDLVPFAAIPIRVPATGHLGLRGAEARGPRASAAPPTVAR